MTSGGAFLRAPVPVDLIKYVGKTAQCLISHLIQFFLIDSIVGIYDNILILI
jgi:hypothetical protein